MRFEFATANRIVFGPGTVREAPGIVSALGHSALVVTGGSLSRAQSLLRQLDLAAVRFTLHPVAGEPTTVDVRHGAAAARAAGCDCVVALGGGSAIDAGKAIAALATNPGDLLDYLEVVGRGQSLPHPPLPLVAIPTTAGTGAEVTRNAVLASPEHRVKASLRSPLMLPRVAIVDPELTLGLPPALTASTGMDALTQVLEPYLSARANPLVDALCLAAIPRAARSLRRAFAQGDDLAARTDMAFASLCGGLALANAGLGAVHGFAAPIGGMFPAPHGAVCAALLPHVLAANFSALQARQPASDLVGRFAEIARLLTGEPAATPADGIRWIHNLCRDLQIPPLSSYGLALADVAAVVEKAAQASSMKANAIALTTAELEQILRSSITGSPA